MLKWINKKRNTKGFTLIELIVVIAILGILAALAIPRLTGVRTNAADRTDAANVKTLRSAANIAVADNGGKVITWSKTAGNAETDGNFAWGNYLDAWPEVPDGTTDESGEYSVDIAADGIVTVKKGDKTAPADWDGKTALE